MRINLITFGKIKDKNIIELINYYQRLTSKYSKIKLISIKESNTKTSKTELEQLATKYKNLVILTEHGKEYATEGFAKFLQNQEPQNGEISFLVGNAFGFEKAAIEKAQTLSLGKMTFPHELTVVILLEQLFRTMNFNRGGKYHK